MLLQGVAPARFQGWEQAFSNRQMAKMAGNTITVTVLSRVVAKMFLNFGCPSKHED
eukprot:NODE_31535_length_394_cov_3.202247.p3 GENE.NODE_31535_length_394_cov_3.202247~~NODE_31535_length_394_cov_3.202247.p3  ORF type:complete len:56 (+),score=3.48 NODE_31535_length_394_cov_3.202247:225-392(+)